MKRASSTDIKPDNVFLHRVGGKETVKVLDFGIAKFLGEVPLADKARLTSTGEFIGTPAFVAPERIRGGPDDSRSDVYSLGAMLYQMVAGILPWDDGHNLRVLCGFVDNTPPKPVSSHRADVLPQLESLIQRAMAFSPAERPSAEELAAALASLSTEVGPTNKGTCAEPRPRDVPVAGLARS